MDAIVESPNAEYATETREELLYNKGMWVGDCLVGYVLLTLRREVACQWRQVGARVGGGDQSRCAIQINSREGVGGSWVVETEEIVDRAVHMAPTETRKVCFPMFKNDFQLLLLSDSNAHEM